MKHSIVLQMLFKRLMPHIKLRRKYQFAMYLVIMIFASLLEMANIGSLMPFLAVLADPPRAYGSSIAQPLITIFGINSANQLLIVLGCFFGFIVALTNVFRLLVLWVGTRLSFAIGADLSNDAFRVSLNQPYNFHLTKNSSEVITGISKANSAVNLFNNTFSLINALVVALAILITLVVVNKEITLALLFSFGSIYLLIIRLTKARLLLNSQKVAKSATVALKTLQEGLGSIREILVDGTQNIYCSQYHEQDRQYRRAQGNINIVSNAPRFLLEAFGMLMILIMASMLAISSSEVAILLPTLGVFAMGAQRLLPVLQQAYSSWIGIQSEKYSLEDFLDVLNQPVENVVTVPKNQLQEFSKTILFENVSFRYDLVSPLAIKDINFEVKRGDRVGVIGKSGGGKSTFIDLVLGLLTPTSGVIKVDNKVLSGVSKSAWRQQIAHVSQAIFLVDASVAENIAFGVPINEIDYKKLIFSSKIAQIHHEIEKWPKGYQTIVGERGARISGGQRQRIGIARAIYKNPNVIVLDEATSALDNQTELAVMTALDQLDNLLNKKITLFIVAHKLSTLRNCSRIIEINGGRITREGSYENIILNLDN
jgi:ABC-type bacteriocin/lantibiotic exporter with double-glycine peptidase domain